jgi:putative transposase
LTAENDGAEYWLGILTEPKHRDVRDILIAAEVGLTGFNVPIHLVFPKIEVQLRLFPVVRSWLKLKRSRTS